MIHIDKDHTVHTHLILKKPRSFQLTAHANTSAKLVRLLFFCTERT